MKKLMISFLFCLVSVYLNGQDYFMYVNGQKRFFEVSATKMLVKSEALDAETISLCGICNAALSVGKCTIASCSEVSFLNLKPKPKPI